MSALPFFDDEMVMRRSLEADSRCLLAQAALNDACQPFVHVPAAGGGVAPPSMSPIRVELCMTRRGGQPVDAHFSVRIRLFNKDKNVRDFTGPPSPIHEGGVCYLNCIVEQDDLIAELVDDRTGEAVEWGSAALSGSVGASHVVVTLAMGPADCIFLDPAFRPLPASQPTQLQFAMSAVAATDETAALMKRYPRGYVVSAEALDGLCECPKPFRVVIPKVSVRLSPAVAACPLAAANRKTVANHQYELLLVAHNTAGPCSSVMSCPLTVTNVNNILELVPSSDTPIEFTGLQAQRDLFILAVLRNRTDAVGVCSAGVRLSEAAALVDEDVVLPDGVGMYGGPLRLGSDARLHTGANQLLLRPPPGSADSATLRVTLQYYDTPRETSTGATPSPGPVVAQVAGQPGKKPSRGKKSSVVSEPTTGAPTAPPVGLTADPIATVANAPSSLPVLAASKRDDVGIASTPVVISDPELATALKHHQSDVYKLLNALMDEVKELQRRVSTIPAGGSVGNGSTGPSAASVPMSVRSGIAAQGVQVLDVPQPVTALPLAVRAKLCDGAALFRHPKTNEALTSDCPPLVTRTWTTSALALRLDAITTCGNPQLDTSPPKTLEFRVTFGPSTFPDVAATGRSKPLLGALSVVHAEQQSGIVTFGLRNGAQQGIIWQEIDGNATASFQRAAAAYKTEKGRAVTINVFDAVTKFEWGTCRVPLAEFHRGAHSPYAVRTVDLPIVHLENTAVVDTLGTLHVTVCAVGTDIINPDAMPRPAVNGPPPSSMSPAAGGNIVVVPKLPAHLLEALDQIGASAQTAAASDSQKIDGIQFGLENLPVDKQKLHMQRAAFIKKTLLSRVASGGTSVTNFMDVPRADDMDVRLSLTERKREELKAVRIQQKLLERVTSTVNVAVPVGRPTLVEVPFTNPFPCTATFTIRTGAKRGAADSAGGGSDPSVAAAQRFGTVFTMSPKETVALPLIVRCPAAMVRSPSRFGSLSMCTAQVAVSNSQEVVKVVNVNVEVLPPFADQTCDVFALSGEASTPGDVERRGPGATASPAAGAAEFFLRVFNSDDFAQSDPQQLTTLKSVIGRMCLHASHDGGLIRQVTTLARVEQTMSGAVKAWEATRITPLPWNVSDATETRVTYVHFYHDEAEERHFATWRVLVSPLVVLEANDVSLGQSNDVPLRILCDSCFSIRRCVQTTTVRDSTTTMATALVKLRPLRAGYDAAPLHVFQGDNLHRYLLRFNAVWPSVRFQRSIRIPIGECCAPVTQQLVFVNNVLPSATSSTRPAPQIEPPSVFTVRTTYEHWVMASPSQFFARPGDRTTITVSLRLPAAPPGALAIPVRVFVNDSQTDKTAECYQLDFSVDPGPVAASSA